MASLRTFLKDKNNREIISWLGSGLVALAGAAWVIFTYFNPSPTPAPAITPTKSETPAAPLRRVDKPVPANVSASNGSVAVGGDVSNSTILGSD